MKKPKLAHILFIIACCLVFLLLPNSVTTSAQYGNTAFVVGLGVDVNEQDNGINLSAQIIAGKPNAASSESYQIVSANGNNVLEAIDNLRKQLGKVLGLSHCYVVVVSDDICNKYNLAKLLDPIVRTEKLGTNVILAHTDKKAKDLLLACEEIGGDAQNVLENLTKYNHEYLLNKDASIYDFYQDYFSKHATGIMVTINYEEQEKTQTSSSGDKNSSESNSSQTQQNNTYPQKKIENKGEGIAFFKGQKKAKINKEILEGLGWMDCTSKFNNISLKNINTPQLKDATVTLEQKGCSIAYSPSINNNIPVLNLDIFVKAKIVGIESKEQVALSDLSSFFHTSFETDLQTLITKQIDLACEFQRENNLDILDFYSIFNTKIHNEWQNYLKSLDNPENYATQIQVFVKTHLKQVN